jgi:ABC-type branched-subunit amino acid transport system substrate-binding protein
MEGGDRSFDCCRKHGLDIGTVCPKASFYRTLSNRNREEGMINIKRILLVTFLSVMIVAIFGSGVAMADQTIRIGFTPPITGVHAAAGSLQVKAIKLAVKEINAAGGINGKKIDLRIIDSQSTNPGALAALQ